MNAIPEPSQAPVQDCPMPVGGYSARVQSKHSETKEIYDVFVKERLSGLLSAGR